MTLMHELRLTSFDELSRVRIGPRVLVQRAGSHYAARYEGCANFVFGETPAEAEEKLLSGRIGKQQRRAMKKWAGTNKQI